MLYKYKRKSDGRIFYSNGTLYKGRGADDHYYLTDGDYPEIQSLQVSEIDLICYYSEVS